MDGGHAVVEILRVVAVVLEVIDGHEVVMLTVDLSVLQSDGLRSVGATVSVVSVRAKNVLTVSTSPHSYLSRITEGQPLLA